LKLIIEIDGEIHNRQDIKERDEQREKDLMNWGYKIYRYSNERVKLELDKVLAEIESVVENLTRSS